MQTTFRWQASAWQRPTQKRPRCSTCQPWSSQGTEVPAGAKGRSGHRAQGQLRDVKHEQNKVKGARAERKGRITGRGEEDYKAKGVAQQGPRGHSFLPLFQASLWSLWKRGILRELAKPCRWTKAVLAPDCWAAGESAPGKGAAGCWAEERCLPVCMQVWRNKHTHILIHTYT